MPYPSLTQEQIETWTDSKVDVTITLLHSMGIPNQGDYDLLIAERERRMEENVPSGVDTDHVWSPLNQ